MNHRSTLIAAIAAMLILVAGIPGVAQQKFTSRTEIVLVPVLVSDTNHKPVFGLKATDFEISDNGKTVQADSFDPPSMNGAKSQPPAMGEAEFSNIDQETPRHLTIIALDPQNTVMADQNRAKDAVLRFLDHSLRSGERVAVIVLGSGGFKVIHDFSIDPGVLRKAITKARLALNLEPLPPGDAAIGVDTKICESCVLNENDIIQQTLAQLQSTMQTLVNDSIANMSADSMRAVAQTYGPLPGRKTLVWVTSGFPFRMDKPVLAGQRSDVSAESGRGTRTDLWNSTFMELNHANVAVYPVDARGLVTALAGGTVMGGPGMGANAGAQIQAAYVGNSDALESMNWIASETGGKRYANTNDIFNAVEHAAGETSAMYMLSFRLPADAHKGWHPLKVRVKQAGVNVSTRAGFFAGRSGKSADQEFDVALRTPFVYTALPMMLRWLDTQAGKGGKKVVSFQFAIQPGMLGIDEADNNHVSVDVRAIAHDAEMKAAGEMSRKVDAHLKPDALPKLAQGGFSYTSQLEVAPGEYTVKIAVRDNVTGRIGAIEAPLRVQ